MIEKIYVVYCDNEYDGFVDTIWLTKEAAEKKRDELNEDYWGYEVDELILNKETMEFE